MERPRPHYEGGEHHPDRHEFTIDERIEIGITAALRGDLVIDQHTARVIGAALANEDRPALEHFASHGELLPAAFREMGLMRLDPTTNEQHTRWIDWLGGYWLERQRQQEEAAERPEVAERLRSYVPRVFISDLASLARRIHHGLWIDADRPPADLKADIAAMLDSSPTPGAERWAVGAAQGFAGIDVVGVTDPALVSQLGRGMRQHGAAYSAWASLAGIDDRSQLDKFSDFHVGSYNTLVDWAQEVTDDLRWREHLDEVVAPEIRPYVSIDYQKFLGEAVRRWDVLRGDDGRIHVFLR